MIAPCVWHLGATLSPDLMAWVQRVAGWHYDSGGCEESELSTEYYPICATNDAVRPHIDEFGGEELGKAIFGLVLRSDGHVLHTRSHPGPIPLAKGDLYMLDPHDQHWTLCPKGGQLIFAAAFIHETDPRYSRPEKLAHDLKWEVLAAHVDYLKEVRDDGMPETEMAREEVRYRGIAPLRPA